jgi:hypothetical protein
MNLGELGQHKGVLKIAKLPAPSKAGAKVGFIQFEGVSARVRYWLSAATHLAVPLAEGAEAETVIECKAGTYNGQDTVEAWLVSFGGPNKGAAKGGWKTFTPKTPEEIHGHAVAMIVVEAMRLSESRNWTDPSVDHFTRVGVSAYLNGIQLIKAAQPVMKQPPAPAPSPEPEKKEEKPKSEEWAFFVSVGGTLDDFDEFKRLCLLQERDPKDVLAECKKANYSLPQIFREVTPTENREKSDPSWGLSKDECREGYYRVQAKFSWPTPAQAPAITMSIFSSWTGERITDVTRMNEKQWATVYRHAYAIEHGEPEPPAFARWKAEQLTGVKTNGS